MIFMFFLAIILIIEKALIRWGNRLAPSKLMEDLERVGWGRTRTSIN